MLTPTLRMLLGAHLVAAMAPGAGCALPREEAPAGHREARVSVAVAQTVGRVSPRFLSVAVDTSLAVGSEFWSLDGQVEGGAGERVVDPFDFSQPKLRRFARHLAPGFLRIGGSHADTVYYDLSGGPLSPAPAPYRKVLTRRMWDGIADFARDLGYEILFNLNAGPGPRDAAGRWTPDNARRLMVYATARGDPVRVWELGNEPNGFPVIHGLGFQVSGTTYAADTARARRLLDEVAPGSLLAGPACAWWPLVGELNPVFPDFMAAGGGNHLDVITWHYYPQQSRRCPFAVRRAGPQVLLEPDNLNEVQRWAAQIEEARDTFAPGPEIWLGETGGAQCGGEPGVSDRYVSSLWWLDQLGAMARRGHKVVVRQALVGSDYGLLAEETLEPRPDYWSSLLWKRLMGAGVLAAKVDGQGSPLGRIRAWAHCAAPSSPGFLTGAVTVLVINLDPERPARLLLEGALGNRYLLYRLDAERLDSPEMRLNGAPIRPDSSGNLPALDPDDGSRAVTLAPAGMAFVVLPNANAPACL